MSKSSKTLLILLCLCVFAFKVVATQRFIENGMKRAQIYASFQDSLGGEVTLMGKSHQVKDVSSSFPVPILLSAILMVACLWVSRGRLRSYWRPIIIKLQLLFFSQKIFRPPRFSYISIWCCLIEY